MCNQITNNEMKTDLTKILSVSGRSGLYRYIAQGRQGVIIEALADKARICVPLSSKITTLADISIYTESGEMKLQEVFLKMNEALAGAAAPSSKADASEITVLFKKAVPDYDGSRFYISHMKKVVDWYNCLHEYASFDFEQPEQPAQE